MTKRKHRNALMIGTACGCLAASVALAEDFNIPSGDLKSALDAYARQTGMSLVFSGEAVKGAHTRGVRGDVTTDQALTRILDGTGFYPRHNTNSAITIVRSPQSSNASDFSVRDMQLAQAAPTRVAVETVTVTSSKLGGADVQSIPISITALSQEQLTATQTAGGPDLLKQVPNMSFTKTNFSGYSIQLRGIGTQAISVTTDPAVAVAFNDIPFIRNHFFEQEFYDLSQVEVLRGPQGTLYGRNATAGVVNLESAKPTDQFEAMASGEIGNFQTRRFEGMINIPIVDDRFDVRAAGEWTKRKGYTEDTTLDEPVDGRDLWSGRLSIAFKPTAKLQTNFVWEHFSENDDRLRSGKQLCKTAPAVTSVDGVAVPAIGGGGIPVFYGAGALALDQNYTSQSCQATSLYSPTAFQVPFGPSLPFIIALDAAGAGNPSIDPYAETTQSTNLRDIQSALLPTYRAKNDTIEFNAVYTVAPALTFTSDTGYSQDFLWSTEDYNRFDTAPGVFAVPVCSGLQCTRFQPDPAAGTNGIPAGAVIFCDPQLGCSDRIVAEDLDEEHAWQLSQEFRLASNFGGPFNFSVGGNYLHYETEENYYVFVNALSAYTSSTGQDLGGTAGGTTLDNSDCLTASNYFGGWQAPNPALGGGTPLEGCVYIDPNPIGKLNNKGHNYFLSQNPYTLNSYALFGELHYDIAKDIKLTGGLRWTIDEKHFVDIPSEVVTQGYGYAVTGVVNQEWAKPSGRLVLDWTPKLDFTDQTLVYGSYSRGYKAGGANPPGAVLGVYGSADVGVATFPVHPATFKPEYINAYELGTKNTMFDGALTLNGDVFYYDYKGYQISEIVDRTAINNNYDARVVGTEITADWEPIPGFRVNFAGGYENTRINDGQSAIDLMDRTAGMPGWMVLKPFATAASNCIFPDYVVAAVLQEQIYPKNQGDLGVGGVGSYACGIAYNNHLDPVTNASYVANPTGDSVLLASTGFNASVPIPIGYLGFNPDDPAINDGQGFAKPLGGNKLPNAPPFTVSFGAQYTLPLSQDWAGTIRADYYWQDYSWARVFNDNPYDRLRGYTNVNLTLILTNQSGWQVMLYDKNVFNTTAITGDFLNSDDSGLTTNVFLTDPKLIGIRVTKNW